MGCILVICTPTPKGETGSGVQISAGVRILPWRGVKPTPSMGGRLPGFPWVKGSGRERKWERK